MKDGGDMEPFIGENFLLENEIAITLYHKDAKDMPISRLLIITAT